MFPVWAEACTSHCRVVVDVKFKTVVSKSFYIKLLSVIFNWILPQITTVKPFLVPPVFDFFVSFFFKKRTNAKGEELTFDLRQRAAAEVIHRLTTKTAYQPSVKQHGCHTRQHSSTSTHTHFIISMWRETHMARKTAKEMTRMILVVRDERWFERMEKMLYCVNCANALLFFLSL